MHCTAGWNPAAATRAIRAVSSPGSISHRPVFAASSAYGSNIAAPRLPSAPSANSFTLRTLRRPADGRSRHSRIRSSRPSPCPSIIAYTRTGSSSRSASRA
jgi:hypothetical protein